MKNIDLGSAYHENKWALSIQTPVTGMDGLLDAMRTQLALRQVHSTRCLHITGPGKQQFRVRDGSRSGAQEAAFQWAKLVSPFRWISISCGKPLKSSLNNMFTKTQQSS